MIVNKVVSLIGFLFFLHAFSSAQENPILSGEPKTVRIDKIQDSSRISQLFDLTEYTILEASDFSLIGNISKIMLYENKYYIFDDSQNCLLCFNKSGKFLAKYQKIGRGPQEYLKIKDFDIDSFSGNVVFLADNNKIIYLSGDLKYLKEVTIPFWVSGILVLNRDIIALYNGAYPQPVDKTNSNYQLFFYNLKNKEITGYFPDSKALEIRFVGKNCLSRSENLIFKQPLTNEFYTLNEMGLASKWKFDFPGNNLDEKIVNKIESLNDLGNLMNNPKLVFQIFNIGLAKKLLSFQFIINRRDYYGFYSEKDKKSYSSISRYTYVNSVPFGQIAGWTKDGILTFIPTTNILKINPKQLPQSLKKVKLLDNPVIAYYHVREN